MHQCLTQGTKTKSVKNGLMAWIVCLSAGLFFFYEFFQLNIFDVINPFLRSDFNLNASQLSLMSSMFLWANILFLLPAGWLLDHYPPKYIILAALSVCVLGTLGFAATESFALASFFHFCTGIGNAFCFLACVVLITRWFSANRQALLVGLIVTMAFLGGMAAHTPFAKLVNSYGWRHALYFDALLGLVFLLWIGCAVKDAPDTFVVVVNKDRKAHRLRQALVNRQTWLAGLYTACLNLPIMILCALWGASYLQVVHQIPAFTASNTVSLIFVGSIIGCPLAGFLSDWQGRRKPLMLIGAVGTLICLIPLLTGTTLSLFAIQILFGLIGFFTSTQVIAYPFIAESNASENTGTATGLASMLIMGSAGFGQLVFGWLMSKHAQSLTYTKADFDYAMWLFPITTVLGLIAVCMTKETYCTRLRTSTS